MKKQLIITLMICGMGFFSAIAQESLPGEGDFDCIEFTTTCEEPGLACGFSEAERVQDAANWENFHCGGGNP